MKTMKHDFMIAKARDLRKNLTDAEVKLWCEIRNRALGARFNRQFIIDDKYIVDFCCVEKRLVIEIDGGQHNENEKDLVRDEYLQSKNYLVLRFWNNEITSNLVGCLEKIVEIMNER